jgi:hypothetical protein
MRTIGELSIACSSIASSMSLLNLLLPVPDFSRKVALDLKGEAVLCKT